jgi:hypothetical protein
MELFPIFEDLNSHGFLILVIVAFEDDTKGSSAKLFLDFESVLYLVFGLVDIVGLIVVEPEVVELTRLISLIRIFIHTSELSFIIFADSLVF